MFEFAPFAFVGNDKRRIVSGPPTQAPAGESLTAMARRWSEVKIGDALVLRW
jgi:hypothetical protein